VNYGVVARQPKMNGRRRPSTGPVADVVIASVLRGGIDTVADPLSHVL